MGVGMTRRERGWATAVFREAASGRVLYANRMTMESGVGSAEGGLGCKDRVIYFGWHTANSVLDLFQQSDALGLG